MNLTGKLITVGIDENGLCRALVQLDPAHVAKIDRSEAHNFAALTIQTVMPHIGEGLKPTTCTLIVDEFERAMQAAFTDGVEFGRNNPSHNALT
jgi:hypothetical protein